MHQTLSHCFPAGLVACGWLHLIGRRSLMIRQRRIGVVMPAFINDSICPNLKCNIKALDRAKVPTIPEKEPVREPEKHLPALYVDAQTKTPAFVFALVALIDFFLVGFIRIK